MWCVCRCFLPSKLLSSHRLAALVIFSSLQQLIMLTASSRSPWGRAAFTSQPDAFLQWVFFLPFLFPLSYFSQLISLPRYFLSTLRFNILAVYLNNYLIIYIYFFLSCMPCVGLNKHVRDSGETQHRYHPERRFTQLGSQYFVYVSCPSVKDRMQLCWTRFPLLYTFHFFFLVKEAIISHVHPPILVVVLFFNLYINLVIYFSSLSSGISSQKRVQKRRDR